MGFGALNETQIDDLITARVGINKVKAPSPAAGDYASPSAAIVSSTDPTVGQAATVFATATPFDIDLSSDATDKQRVGELVTDVALRNKTLISFTVKLKKTGAPTGTAVARLRKVSDDSIVATSSNSLDVATLTTSFAEVVFTFPDGTKTPNESFRIMVEYSGGNTTNFVDIPHDNTNPYAGGTHTMYSGVYTDTGTFDVSAKITTSDIHVSHIFDNNTASKWASDSEANPYVIIDLGSVQLVSGIEVFWQANGRPTGFDIDYSEDNITFIETSQQSVAQPTETADYTEHAFNTVYARYIRVQANEIVAMEIAEIKYYSKTTDRVISRHGHGDAE